jgi:flagellar basal-body rod protein FlgG
MQAGAVAIGRLRVVCFPEAEDQLVPVGGNCWRAPTDTPPVVAEETVVRQGYREGSNVKLVDEMVNMIAVTRAYEANVKFVNVSSDTTKSLLGVAMV